MTDELINNLLKNNKSDLEQANKILKLLRKLNSKKFAHILENSLIQEVISICEQNMLLESFTEINKEGEK